MTRIAFAALLTASLAAGAAQAQAPSTFGAGGHGTGGNVVGGGLSASIIGGGEDRTIQYSQSGAGGGGVGWAQAGRIARFGATQGEGLQVEYLAPAPAGSGREAWMLGGGDNTEVVYGGSR